jgi:sarcosine oxidase
VSARRTIVIGAGLMGAAVAWQLARRGAEVVLLERTHPANEEGSSHGSARIFRYAYPDPLYTGLVVSARADWDELERDSGRELIAPTGALDFGGLRDAPGLARVLAAEGVKHELMSAAAASERWPGLVFDTDVLWHPGAGVIDAQTAVETMVALAVAAGAEAHEDWDVARVERTGTGFAAVSRTGARVEGESVVVCAGGWLPELIPALPLSDGFRAALPTFTVREEAAFHFPYRDAERPWPTFIHKSERIQMYGLPGGRDAGFRGQKVAEYNGGASIPGASAASGTIPPAVAARTLDFVRGTLPGLEPAAYAETTCLFTNTPSEDFVLDGEDGLLVVSACSGHGAKVAPAIGRIVAEARLDGAVPDRRFLVAA